MAICKFFQQGHCRKGSDCDFEHVKGDRNPFANVEPSSQAHSHPQSQGPRRKSTRKQNKNDSTTSISNSDVHINKPQHGNANNKTQTPKGKRSNKNSQGSINNNNNKNSNNKNHSKSKSGSFSPQSMSKSFTKLPLFSDKQAVSNAPTVKTPTVKDYSNMVLADLADRPISWHFSSYGLSLNLTQSLPFPFLGTTEISAEELRLQVYAEAAATGGHIENYVKVVEEMKKRAENQTKALIPQLETVISDLFRANNIQIGPVASASVPAAGLLQQQQEALKLTLQQRMNNNPNLVMNNNLYNNANNNIGITQQPQPQTQNQFQFQLQSQDQVSMLPFDPLQSSHSSLQPPNSNDIIPEDFFTFGSIPEMPPF